MHISQCYQCKTYHTSFTVEPTGDQLSSLEQVQQDTATIVNKNAFTTIQCRRSKNSWSKSCFQVEGALFLLGFYEKASDGQSPVSRRSPVRNLPPIRLAPLGGRTHKPFVLKNMKTLNLNVVPTCGVTWMRNAYLRVEYILHTSPMNN